MKNEDKMIDSLLHEHARKGGKEDAEFIASLEKRLDEEEGRTAMETTTSSRSGRKFRLSASGGVGIAAALTVAALGFYGWKQQRETDLAMNDSYEPEMQNSEASYSEMKVRSRVPLAKSSLKTEGKNKQLSEREEITSYEAARQDSALASNAARKKMSQTVQRRPSGPSSAMSKVIAASTVSPSAIPVPSLDIGDVDSFGDEMGRRVVQPGNRYGALADNTFKSPWKHPLSTFSVDVDTASYTNIRKMILSDQAVPADAVRIEEMINYFNYDYPQPDGKHPFSVNVEMASCPWNTEHRLVKIGLQGKEIIREKRPAANLVFLLDVSGSMHSEDKLPLLVDSMKILLAELNPDDSVSIVVYAGAQGLALAPTYVDDAGRKTILNKLDHFQSGGSTNGGAGIHLAYKMAKKNFVKGGVNRVILGTDGDFNVGVTDNQSLVSMIEHEAKSGVFLSVLGFGQGNLNDAMLEEITNKGNGNYSYIDNLREGRKVFLDDMMGNMVTIAKDVKIQVEFNPAKVKSYRLIGYANRMLREEDFKNKLIDAGEIGAGHTVTALYEIVPGHANAIPAMDGLKYQKNKPLAKPVEREVVDSPEVMTVKLAYKQADATKETESTYFDTSVIDTGKDWKSASHDFQFASSVGLFGMLQRGSSHSGKGGYPLVRNLAEAGRGSDSKGLRTEFSDLVRKVCK